VLRDREALGVSCVLAPVPRPDSTASWNCVRPSSGSYGVWTIGIKDTTGCAANLRSGCMAASSTSARPRPSDSPFSNSVNGVSKQAAVALCH
jgi:hypothetical protein